MSLRVLIIEDETLAAEKLIRQLKTVKPDATIGPVCASIKTAVETLTNERFDLILSDIHLTDGLSFEVLKSAPVETPVIFTTAYDQYAIEAFKTNSIDYLLKPVRKADLQAALEKFERLRSSHTDQAQKLEQLIASFDSMEKPYKERFLVEAREGELKTIGLEEVAYFYATGKYTFIVCRNGKEYFSNENISQLSELLDPKLFFQLNRGFIAHIESIKQIFKYSKSRLKLELEPSSSQEVIVSSERAAEFKKWLGR